MKHNWELHYVSWAMKEQPLSDKMFLWEGLRWKIRSMIVDGMQIKTEKMKDANVDLNPQDYYRCQNVLYHFKDLCRSALSNNYPSHSTSIFWCHHCYSSAVLECNGFCGWTILLLIKVCQKHLGQRSKAASMANGFWGYETIFWLFTSYCFIWL